MNKIFAQYGAGNIGRGFIGALFAKAGYEVRFIDVDDTVIRALNTEQKYTVEIVSNDGSVYEEIRNVSGVDGRDENAVIDTIAAADIMATAVGVNVLSKIAPLLARGFKQRIQNGNTDPMNIIICENLMDADKLLRSRICEHLDAYECEIFDRTVGLVEASIGRMVPVMSAEDKLKDPLYVRAESYRELPVDADAVKGTLPGIDGLRPVRPFAFYIRRKLFVHNMGHALAAYLGCISGCEYIWQAASDPVLALIAERAMTESAAALSAVYRVSMYDITLHISDLLLRFGNRALGDTIARVGGDSFRKTGLNDRLAGAVSFIRGAGFDPVYVCAGLAAAFYFDNGPDDAGTRAFLDMVRTDGAEHVLKNHCGLSGCDAELIYVSRYAKAIESGCGLRGILETAEDIERGVLKSRRVM